MSSLVDTTLLDEISDLLKDTGKLPAMTAQRLQLGISLQIANAMNDLKRSMDDLVEQKKIQNGRVSKLEARTDALEANNILFWVKKNPRSAFMLGFVFVVLLDVMVDSMSSINVLELIRKLAGL